MRVLELLCAQLTHLSVSAMMPTCARRRKPQVAPKLAAGGNLMAKKTPSVSLGAFFFMLARSAPQQAQAQDRRVAGASSVLFKFTPSPVPERFNAKQRSWNDDQDDVRHDRDGNNQHCSVERVPHTQLEVM